MRLFLEPQFVNRGTIGPWWGKAARVVSALFGGRYVNPDFPDTEYGRTPLSWAAGNGHEGVAKLILGRKDVNPNSSSKSGQTPLTLATESGHDRVAGLLQAQNRQPIS